MSSDKAATLRDSAKCDLATLDGNAQRSMSLEDLVDEFDKLLAELEPLTSTTMPAPDTSDADRLNPDAAYNVVWEYVSGASSLVMRIVATVDECKSQQEAVVDALDIVRGDLGEDGFGHLSGLVDLENPDVEEA